MTQDLNRFIIPAAAAAGALCIAWTGLGFVGTSYLALAMTLAIGAVYAAGIREMQRYRADTTSLRAALLELAQPLDSLGTWLARVPATL